MKKMICSGIAALGCMAAACAQDAGAPAQANRSAEWKANFALAVKDESKVAAAIAAIPEAQRAEFATAVLSVLQTKPTDKASWAKNYSDTAAALIDGAGKSKAAVLSAVAADVVLASVKGEARELNSKSAADLGLLAKDISSQLKGDDRAAFDNALLQAASKQKAVDGTAHKESICAVAVGSFVGAGDAKKASFAETFAVVGLDDLGAVSATFANLFNQRNNNLSDEEYQKVALQYLQGLATRLAGQPDAAKRFAYALEALQNAATNSDLFGQELKGKIAELTGKTGTTPENLVAANADLSANQTLANRVTSLLSAVSRRGHHEGPQGPFGLPFIVGPNRPPAYQDQSI